MTEQDLIIQDLRRENAMLKKQLARYTNAQEAEQVWQVRNCNGNNWFCDGRCTICEHNMVRHSTTGGIY